ncbi:hypothetical protein QYF36_022211 [Acer negundo]|nr:hypothetical protein QYF36_022211 [Acer negundo]
MPRHVIHYGRRVMSRQRYRVEKAEKESGLEFIINKSLCFAVGGATEKGIWMILGRASGTEDKMTPHALAKCACFCDKERSPLKSFTGRCYEEASLFMYLCPRRDIKQEYRTIPILANVLDDNDSSNGLSWSVQRLLGA